MSNGAASVSFGVTPVPEAFRTVIHGVWLRPVAEIATPGGPVLHMLRSDSPEFSGFGEVYFSLVEPGAVKAWKRHKRQTQTFAVPSGLMEVVIYDSRGDSPTHGATASFILGRPGHYSLLQIPPGLWYGFTCRSARAAVLANCANIPHDPEESERLPQDSPLIPYRLEGSLFVADGGDQ